MIDDARHGRGGTEIEFIDGGESTNSPGRRKGRVTEYTLQTSGLLQYQRHVAVRLHDDPAKADGIHVTGLVDTRDGSEAVALKIRGMVEEPDFSAFRPKAIQMPRQPAQDIIGRRIEPACALNDQRRLYVTERLAIEIVALKEASLITGTQR